ncbi:uncharacterized protein (TIGR02449 family) [Cocleimonas flava]|uniref:Uncharacterized protein (TIGR02449 family) n=2 Tax=Thiotrichaceae TaxID=135617 RepID=A0A4R1F5G4_9GAMM|nr:uncharacterized protein (TIGR02449 family) [Cocleimonas flava]
MFLKFKLRILKLFHFLGIFEANFHSGFNVIMNKTSNDEQLSITMKIDKLESSVKELLAYCKKLSEENDAFKFSNQQLMLERSELQAKNDKVRGQVEAMMERLKAMDKAS